MNSGDLKERIDIYEQTVTRTPYGDVKEVHDVKKYSTRAMIRFNAENKLSNEGEVYFLTNRTFIVRHYVPVDEHDQIEWKGIRYNILSINRNKYFNDIEIYAEQVNK